jgi:hypothetical protein
MKDKKRMERKVASFFAEWIEKEKNISYEVIEDEEDEETDFILKPHPSNKKTLFLQIVTCDENLIKSFVESYKNNGAIVDLESKYEDTIKKQIIKKGLHYPSDIQGKLTLLVYSDFANLNEKYIQRITKVECEKTNFINIYLITLPDDENKKSHPQNKGNIIKLK